MPSLLVSFTDAGKHRLFYGHKNIMEHRSTSKFAISFVLSVVAPLSALAADSSGFIIGRASSAYSEISVDGYIDEPAWGRLPVLDDFLIVDPDSLEAPKYRTEVQAVYDDDGIYISAFNFQPADTFVARMSGRDGRVRRDSFKVSIDASGQGLYGYSMQVHLGGSVSDGTILPERQMSRDWDGPWESATQENDNGWSAEIFIPWSMMPLPAAEDGKRPLGIHFERTVAHLDERWSWPPLPNTSPEYLSAFHKFDLLGVSPQAQYTFYPYASSTYNNMTGEVNSRIGADLYWRPNSNTQLSATLNPDFGTVESDNIVVNLGAFETFNSEKRSFFLEGIEIFEAHPRASGGPGGPPLTVLNTRRIGAAAQFDVPQDFETSRTERNQPTELIGAMKFTGQTGSWRHGVMFAAEDDTTIRAFGKDSRSVNITTEGSDFLVGRLLYEDTSGGGRRAIGWIGTHLLHPDQKATVNGIDVHYFSADTKWNIDGQALSSEVNGVTGNGLLFDVEYNPARGIKHEVTATYLDDKVDLNDIGFLRRNDEMVLDYEFSTSRSGFEQYRARSRSVRLVNQWNSAGEPIRLGVFGSQEITFHNNSELSADLRYFPPRVDDTTSRGNGSYKIPSRLAAEVEWSSDRSRPVSYVVGIGNTQEDLKRSNVSTKLGVNWQPNDRFALENEISYTDRKSLLVHNTLGQITAFRANEWSSRINASYFINPRQQFRLSMQWTGLKASEDKFYQVSPDSVESLQRIPKPTGESEDFAVNRMSFQARYQWEIAPLSDLFVVYTRGSNPSEEYRDNFSSMFSDAWSEKLAETWVVKLRYRL